MIAPQSSEQYGRFCSHIAAELHPPALQKFHENLKREIHDDYDLAIRRAIVEYILLDPSERQRVKIHRTPQVFRPHIIRAPIAWHEAMNETKRELQSTLHANNPIMAALQQLWDEHYADQRFVKFDDLLEAPLPMVPHEFEKFIEQKVNQMRQTLLNE